MKEVEINVNSDKFEYNGVKYDCKWVVKKDKKIILQEAEESHKEQLESMYEKDSLAPDHVKLYMDDNGNPLYLMMVYVIKYKNKSTFGTGRYACGCYQPIENGLVNQEGFNVVYPHPYQGSVCW